MKKEISKFFALCIIFATFTGEQRNSLSQIADMADDQAT
jgi:hypothetical protein